MSPQLALLAFGAGLVVAIVTSPVGVSGAVFLLPVQLDILRIPSPAVTPTNLLFNVVSTPGAILRYRRTGALGGQLTRQLITGTLPGVVIGTVVRVYVAPGDRIFRLLAAAVLLPLGIWLCTCRRDRTAPWRAVSGTTITVMGVGVGIVGGIYGIGGGSLLGPILVGAGLSVAVVAPAALAATFLTSVAGVCTFSLLSLTTDGPVSPDWGVGLLCGLGGLIGGYLGARLQPRVPETGLRFLLGALAIGLAVSYVVQAARG
ncbi:TSUP family transporter [Pseudonocardia sp.]|uniref:TSUP family transporter n=1 Tax=Pseudonocardia sp. TaxID=60912 RepID=UPI003D140402